MFSSVAHLARANPFNAPHLQLVHDVSGPRSPPGPPRRSRHLAAAAVEGEVTPCPVRALVSCCSPLCLRDLGRIGRSRKDAPALDLRTGL
ncbi:solute carrier family 25 (mitochondrial carrier; adenine nucleotide translocator), member 3, isoform CRA_d [Rattus norvegicus]|uniref:Solute carrier family 25 (Mitochondrial carrier; adenine nucleotide translocator), member 3, isoform CRA_d n=1 Tax=Rattus norvegicus TaxID=10116 RepID=A6IFV5_RAT|nr:solute carrier family 25 (mitochondrial carrier; adenine nucleotide translocator), member 3, isoform CRA_d [Rattus norvegicus]